MSDEDESLDIQYSESGEDEFFEGEDLQDVELGS